ncbi:MAG: hypothetical protein S0880_10130 [Actinomycetota bacterium]|nr:hypothetical protein [Actinomycetota bacterium]
MDPAIARRMHEVTGPVHGFVYFAPEAAEEYAALGVEGMAGYFASRAAAMGPVGPEMVVATFFNFCPDVVAAALPAAWAKADAADLQRARWRAAGRVLDRVASDVLAGDDLDEAVGLAARVCDGVGYEGKPLAAANRAQPLPDEPLVRLWQLVTTIREWRGDAHIAVLQAASVDAVEALVLHAATGTVSEKVLKATRAWPDEAWQRAVVRLAERGLVDDTGAFTDAGRAFRADIEDRTDATSLPLWEAIGDESTARLDELLAPVARALVASGAFGRARRRTDDSSTD